MNAENRLEGVNYQPRRLKELQTRLNSLSIDCASSQNKLFSGNDWKQSDEEH